MQVEKVEFETYADGMNTTLKGYVPLSRHKELEALLEERVHKSKFEIIKKKIEDFVRIDVYQAHVAKASDDILEIYQRFKPLVSHLTLDTKIKDVKEGLDQHFKGFSIKRDCAKDKADTMRSVNTMRAMIDDQTANISQLKDEAKYLLNEVEKKASSEEIAEMKILFGEMPTRAEVTSVRTDLFDSMQQFTEDNATFKREFEKQNEIIARYDEVIS